MKNEGIAALVKKIHRRVTAMNRRSGRLAVCRRPFTARAVAALITLSAVVPLLFSEVRSADRYDLAFVQLPVSDALEAGGDINNTILSGRYLRGMQIVLASTENVATSQRVATKGFSVQRIRRSARMVRIWSFRESDLRRIVCRFGKSPSMTLSHNKS